MSPDVSFVGVLPAYPIFEATWSPDGNFLAYAVNVDRPAEPFRREIEVRGLPDWRLQQRWVPPGPAFELAWAPNGRRIAFAFARSRPWTSVGLAQLGNDDWQELDAGDAGWQMGIDMWLDDATLLLSSGCGTACRILYTLQVDTGEVLRLRNVWDTPPDGRVLGMRFFFNADQTWFAATSFGNVLPRTVVVLWEDLEQFAPLAAGLGTRFTSAESWNGSTLAFLAYPGGDPGEWPAPPRPDLHTWGLGTGERRLVAHGVFRASFSPLGDQIAALFVGEPRDNGAGAISAEGVIPHLALLSWPEGRLLTAHPLGKRPIDDVWDYDDIPTPIWSPEGEALAFRPSPGGLSVMGRDGLVKEVLSGRELGWASPYPMFEWPADWGADGYLAMLVDGWIWLVRVPLEGRR